MKIARLVLLLTALVFAGFGLWLLIDPEAMTRVGVDLISPSGRIEIRAFYGGLELGFGGFLLYASRSDSKIWVTAGLLAAGMVLGGITFGRLIGFLVDGEPLPIILIFTALETIGAAINLSAWASVRRADGI